MNARATFVDGVEMNRRSPSTFRIPAKSDRESIMCNWLVKLGVTFPGYVYQRGIITGERFWVRVSKQLTDGKYEGVVEQSDMVASEAHGIQNGDTLSFGPQHILGFELQ